MKITIDSKSGFCFGVVYAIRRAEEELENQGTLYCLGDIVHNNVEVKRLENLGLKTIDHETFKQLHNTSVLIRAHGEPPETYRIAAQNNIKLIDASCPVVLSLQNRVRTGHLKMSENGGQTVIYGKHGHAEVIGLVGQTGNTGIVVSNESDLEKIDFTKPVNMFSQTTKSKEGYKKISAEIRKRMTEQQDTEDVDFEANNSICGQVSSRDKELRTFATLHEVIVFVSGLKSSNGKVLYDVCKAQNPNSYFISDTEDIDFSWFTKDSSVGICGATSTPSWLMEKVQNAILEYFQN